MIRQDISSAIDEENIVHLNPSPDSAHGELNKDKMQERNESKSLFQYFILLYTCKIGTGTGHLVGGGASYLKGEKKREKNPKKMVNFFRPETAI